MELHALLSDFFGDFRAALHDSDGAPVPRDTVTREYRALKNHLLATYSPGDRVGIRLDREYRALLALCACMEVGLCYVPFLVSWPEPHAKKLAALAGVRGILDRKTVDEVCALPEAPDRAPFPFDGESELYLLFTSGSTGEPKGVVIRRKSFTHFLSCLERDFAEVPPGLEALLVSDFTFDFSLIDIGLFLLKKNSLRFSRYDGNVFALAEEIRRWRIAVVGVGPVSLRMLLRDSVFPRLDLSSLRCICLAGARILEEHYRLFLAKLPAEARLYNVYGPTEVTIYSHVWKFRRNAAEDLCDGNVTVGRISPGVDWILVNERNEALGPREQGELWLGGVQALKEYAGAPEMTAACKAEKNGVSYYRTGDLVFFDETGRFFVVGRRDDTVNRRGTRVNLLDIDGQIQRVPQVQDSATVAVPSDSVENWIVTYVVPKGTADEAALRRSLAEFLPESHVPDYIVFRDSFPTTVTGKTCRRTLTSQSRETLASGYQTSR